MEKPWRWGDRNSVTLDLDEGPKTYTLLPVEREKIESFRRRLALARQVSHVLAKAQETFENGKADYAGAAARLKDLLTESGVALNEEFTVAREVGAFYVPSGLEANFGGLVDLLCEFCGETIERLTAVKPESPPKPEDEAKPEVHAADSEAPELQTTAGG